MCKSPSPPLADIVLFGLYLSGFPSRFLKHVWEWFPHPYKECFILLSNRCGISQFTPLGPASSLAHCSVSGSDTICNSRNLPLTDIVFFGFPFRTSPQGFKTRLLGRGFHTLIKNVLFFSPTDVGSHSYLTLRKDDSLIQSSKH